MKFRTIELNVLVMDSFLDTDIDCFTLLKVMHKNKRIQTKIQFDTLSRIDLIKINHQTWIGDILVRWHCFLSLCVQLCCVCPSAGQNTSKSMQFCDTTWANNSKHDIYLRLLCDDWTDFCVVCMFVLLKSVFFLSVFLFFYFSFYLFMLFVVCSSVHF